MSSPGPGGATHDLELSPPAGESRATRDGWRDRFQRWLLDPAVQGWAVAHPLTRWLVRRRTRQLMDVMGGFVHAQVLLACVRLDLFAILAGGPARLEELAARTGLPAAPLHRLLLSAQAIGLLEHRSGHRFGLGPLGVPVATHEGLRAMIEHNHLLYQDMADPVAFLSNAWQGGMANYWPYAHTDTPAAPGGASHVDRVARYSALMAGSQNFVTAEILRSYDFSSHRCVLDVGSGQGRWVAELAQREPALRFQLVDLPPVLDIARGRHAALGLESRCTYHPGSFIEDALPKGADLITLVRVAHDHPDRVVQGLFHRIHQALPVGGTLLLAEPMAQPEPNRASVDAYFHCYLLAMGAGELRTPDRLSAMLRGSGFGHVELLPNGMPIHTRLLVARKNQGLPSS
ncbi:MAG: methyltransferase domain-containing protein [Rhodoferax sp.]|nr:methyltransferase domain-containing protein [Rhodoferax sp.]